MQRAHWKDEQAFNETVRCVFIWLADPNAIFSNIICKVMLLDDNSVQLKSRIAPHEIKNEGHDEVKMDYATCPATGTLFLIPVTVIFECILVKTDFMTAFLQTEEALHNIDIVPFYDSREKMFYWVVLTVP